MSVWWGFQRLSFSAGDRKKGWGGWVGWVMSPPLVASAQNAADGLRLLPFFGSNFPRIRGSLVWSQPVLCKLVAGLFTGCLLKF